VAAKLQQTAEQILLGRIALDAAANQAASRWNSAVDALIAELEARREVVLGNMRIELNARQKLLDAQHDELCVSSGQAFAAALASENTRCEIKEQHSAAALQLQSRIGQCPRAPLLFELFEDEALQTIRENICIVGVVRDFDVDPTKSVAESIPYGLKYMCYGKTQPCDWITTDDVQVSVRAADGSAIDPACSQISIPNPGILEVIVDFKDLAASVVWLDIKVVGVALRSKQVYGRLQSAGKLLWKVPLGNGPTDFTPLLGPDNSVVILRRTLDCFDGSTGETLWSVNSASGFVAPAASDAVKQVFALQRDGYLMALNAHTGEVNWQHQAPLPISEMKQLCSQDGILVISGRSIHVLNGLTGEQLWSAACNSARYNSPAIGNDGTVYFAISPDEMEARNGFTGEVKWRFKLKAGRWSSLFCVDESGNVYASMYVRFMNCMYVFYADLVFLLCRRGR
jgi:hypothetical protein